MYAVIFRSKRTVTHENLYQEKSELMNQMVKDTPGYVSHVSIRDPITREGITVSYFQTLESIRTWRNNPKHLEVQELGRSLFYEWYEVEITKLQSSASERSVLDLLRTQSETLDQLKSLGVIRTDNAPVGDYAEWLISRFYEGELLPRSSKGVDVLTSDGRKIQVKARTTDRSMKKALQSSAIRDWDFTEMVVILFDRLDYSIIQASLVPIRTVQELVKYSKHDNKSFISDLRKLQNHPGVQDITIGLLSLQGSL